MNPLQRYTAYLLVLLPLALAELESPMSIPIPSPLVTLKDCPACGEFLIPASQEICEECEIEIHNSYDDFLTQGPDDCWECPQCGRVLPSPWCPTCDLRWQ